MSKELATGLSKSKAAHWFNILNRHKLIHRLDHTPRYFAGSSRPDRTGTEYYVEALDSNLGLVLVGLDEVLIPGVDSARLAQVDVSAVPAGVVAALEKAVYEAQVTL